MSDNQCQIMKTYNKTQNLKNRLKLAGLIILVGLPLLIINECSGQRLKYTDTQDIKTAQEIVNGTDFISYESKDGSVVKLGDTLVVGMPSTNTNNYTYIYFGKFTMGGAMLSPPQQYLGAALRNQKVIVDRIYVYHSKMSRKSILGVFMYIRNPNAPAMGNTQSIAGYEESILFGEIINPHAPLTRDQAIAKLKEAKDLMDLGVIDKSKFDSLKTELTPIITQK